MSLEQINLPSKLRYLPYIPKNEHVQFMKAETFIMNFDEFILADVDDIAHTYNDMVKLGLNRLPYDRQLIMMYRHEQGRDLYMPIYAYNDPEYPPGPFIFLGNQQELLSQMNHDKEKTMDKLMSVLTT